MNTVKLLVAILVIASLFAGFSYLLFKIRQTLCTRCPFRDKCIKNQHKENYIPECQKYHFLNDNSHTYWP